MEHLSGKKLIIVILILFITFIAEVTGGILFKSLSLVSDSFHVFSDIFALFIAYITLTIAVKKPATDKLTFGYHRLEVFSAIINGFTLAVISIYIISEAIERYRNPADVIPIPSLIIAVIGLIVNIISARILHSHDKHDEDINLKGAYLHIIGDALASGAVIAGMIAIIFTGINVIDPVIAFLISLFILYSSLRIIKNGIEILLHKSPKNLNEIKQDLKCIDGIIDVEDLHLWQICSHLTIGTAHIIVSIENPEQTTIVDRKVKKMLEEKYNIKHMTAQYETLSMSRSHSHGGDLNH